MWISTTTVPTLRRKGLKTAGGCCGFLGTGEPLNVLSKGLALPVLHFKSLRCLKSVGEKGKEK